MKEWKVGEKRKELVELKVKKNVNLTCNDTSRSADLLAHVNIVRRTSSTETQSNKTRQA